MNARLSMATLGRAAPDAEISGCPPALILTSLERYLADRESGQAEAPPPSRTGALQPTSAPRAWPSATAGTILVPVVDTVALGVALRLVGEHARPDGPYDGAN